MIELQCGTCGKPFQAYPSDERRYCSRRCYEIGKRKNYQFQCALCGKNMILTPRECRSGGRHYCSKRCAARSVNPLGSQTGIFSRTWKGGNFISKEGYRMVLIPGLGKYTTEQKRIMEKRLGHPLQKDEVVHHLDGNKLNNDPENLIICTRSEHPTIHRRLKKGELEK